MKHTRQSYSPFMYYDYEKYLTLMISMEIIDDNNFNTRGSFFCSYQINSMKCTTRLILTAGK